MTDLTFSELPRGIAQCSGSTIRNDDGSVTVSVRLQSAGRSAGLQSGTDVALIVDASFSMFAGYYRSGKILDFVDAVAGFLAPFDDDGIDVYLHSLRDAPFRHLGAFRVAADVSAELGPFLEAGSAMKAMGQKTTCAAAIRDAAQRLLDQKGSKNVFLEVLTDGMFDDQAELEATIVELGRKYNTAQNPNRFRIHFTGLGSGGAQGVQFLKKLDDELESKYPGYIDCVDYDAASTVEDNVANVVKELSAGVVLDTGAAMLTVTDDQGKPVQHIRTGDDADWEPGHEKSLEQLPVVLELFANFAAPPAGLRLTLAFVNGSTGDFEEITLVAKV